MGEGLALSGYNQRVSRIQYSGQMQGVCTTSWAVRRPNTVTPPKLHFKIWIPSCSWKLSGYQLLALEPLDENVQGQIAQIAREHSGGHAVLRNLLDSHKQEHGSALEASLQDMGAQFQAEVAKLSAEHSDHARSVARP